MTEHITISRELLRQAFDYLNCAKDGEWDGDTVAGREMLDKLRAALEQPAVEPYGHVTVRRLSQRFENHVDQYTFYPAGNPPYLDNVDECITVYTTPQAQQPPRIGSGVTVEQTLEQWEHDFSNPMTPEQQADWVKREREFASAQAQQPAPVQHLTNPPSLRDRKPAFVMMKLRSGPPSFVDAAQPRKAVKLSDDELVDHYCAIADGKEWAIGGLSDAVPFARAIETAVLKKNGVTE